MLLSDVSIKRPVFATMLMLALVTLGFVSYRRLSIDEWPNVQFPFIVVQTTYPGASPETVERDVTRKIEEAVNPLQGVRNLTSSSLEGLSTIFIEFELNVKDIQAQQDVRSKIEEIREELPTDIENPKVLRFNIADTPIVSLCLTSSTRSLRELTTLADETLRKAFEGVDGVGQVIVVGGEKRTIAVELDPARLSARAITVDQVMGVLGSENMEIPAGRLELGPREQLVRVAGRLLQPADFDKLVVDTRDGVPIRLGDVATTIDDAEEARSAAMYNGSPAIAIDLRKITGGNTVQIAERAKATADELRKILPEGVELTIVRDNSQWIRDSVEDVKTTLILGALLTVLVVFTFLNSWRSTVITGLTLPVSVIASFLAIHTFGYTLNTMTLMALSLAIGILIDDAIVVRENIVRHVHMGEDHYQAAKRGTSEIGFAVVATTMSTLCVFVPVAFMGGIVGKFFREFGVTVAAAVSVSLFVSFTLDPMLSSVWYDPVAEENAVRHGIGKALERFNRSFIGLGKWYRGVIGWALSHRVLVIGIAVAAFIGAMVLFPLVGGTFMPDADTGQLTVSVASPVGSTLNYTRDRLREVSSLIRRHDQEVAYTYETIAGGFTAQVNEAEIFVKLAERRKFAFGFEKGPDGKKHFVSGYRGTRTLRQSELMRLFRRELETLPGTTIAVLEAGGFGGSERPIQVYVQGDQMEELRRISGEVLKVVRATPGAIEARSGLEEERPEVRLDLQRDVANEMGIGIGTLARTLRPALASQKASTWQDPSGENHDVTVRLPKSARRSIDQLAALPLASAGRDPRTGAPMIVTLGQVADISESSSPQKIERRDMKRVVSVEANFEGRALTEVSKDIQTGVDAKIQIPSGYRVRMGGETEMFTETVGYIVESLLLAVIFIYLVLASQFGSFLQPLAIMFSMPLSLVGVMIALLSSHTTFNLMSMIGVILLMGLVTKNAILLIDFANKGRESGKTRRDALIDAGEIRLRPIAMTTLAMIFGMMPLALALGAGAEFRAPMARAVIGGLVTGSLLTLVVVPVVYTLFDDLGGKVSGLLTGGRSRNAHATGEKTGT
jgi:hydrophobic/amphiphilic exporter-1 (mainly G- bacteria), HAE1 family